MRSSKGLVLLALCAMMAAATAMALASAEQAASRAIQHGRHGVGIAVSLAGSEANVQFLKEWYSAAVAERLRSIPLVVQSMLIGTIMFCPPIIAMLSFDSVSAELQFRSVRYWTVRMRRTSFFLGKVAGVFSVAAIATLLTQVIGWTIAISRDVSPVVDTVSWGLIVWATTLPIVLAWCSLAVFISSLVRSPILALMLNFAANVFLLILWGVGHRSDAEWLRWAFPNHADAWLLSPAPADVAIGLAATLGFSAVFCLAGAIIFEKRDL